MPERRPVKRPLKEKAIISFFIAIGLLYVYRLLFNESAFGPSPHHWTAIIYIPVGILILMGIIVGVWRGMEE